VTESANLPESSRLAHLLAARLVHDITGSLSGIVTGIDLLDSPDLGDDAKTLIRSSLKRLLNSLDLERALHSTRAAPIAQSHLKGLASALLADLQIELTWKAGHDALPGPQGRILLALIQIASQTVTADGAIEVEVWNQPPRLRIISAGRKVRAAPEMLAGLAGTPSDGEMGGRWATAFLVLQDIKAAGGILIADVASDRFTIEATFPEV